MNSWVFVFLEFVSIKSASCIMILKDLNCPFASEVVTHRDSNFALHWKHLLISSDCLSIHDPYKHFLQSRLQARFEYEQETYQPDGFLRRNFSDPEGLQANVEDQK